MSKRAYTGKEIEQIMLLAQDVISLNTPIANKGEFEDAHIELGDMIEDLSPTPAEEVAIMNRQEVIADYLQRYLDSREREIIVLRFGFGHNRPMTLEEVGEEYGITRERVRQIEARALRKLRRQFAKNKITWENI